MAVSLLTLLALTQLWTQASTLQVTPNSKCASLCLDNPKQDVSDPQTSNIYGSDIVCTNEDLDGTAVGQKFEQCLNCLQNSTAKTATETDQAWFLYNLRYAFNTCLFQAENASKTFSTPCGLDTVCNPLKPAFESDLSIPSLATQYSYCSASNATFLSNHQNDCAACLKEKSDEYYLANYLIALDAGCIQQPVPGTLLGLDGTMFSKTKVNITTPTIPTTAKKHAILTPAAIIGISVAGGVVILILIAILFICFRKRLARQKNIQFKSALDDRFGSTDITMPVHGAYNDPDRPKATAYESVGLTKIPAKIRISLKEDKSFRPSKESYFPPQDYYHPALQPHTHEETARGLGFKVISGPNPRNNGSTIQEPSPMYSPPGSTQPTYTPNTNANSLTSSTVSQASPTSASITRTNLFRNSTSTTHSNTLSTKSKASPISGPGLPKPVSPRRNSNLFSNNPITHSDPPSVPNPRHTRDLSLGRGVLNGFGSSEADGRNQIQISGPMVDVTSRYDDETEARKRAERERLYREGYAARHMKKEEARGAGKARRSEEEEELW